MIIAIIVDPFPIIIKSLIILIIYLFLVYTVKKRTIQIDIDPNLSIVCDGFEAMQWKLFINILTI